MASLTGQSIASSYEQLLSLPDGGGNGTTLVDITDGDGVTTFSLKLAQYHAEIRGTTGTGATGAGKLNLSTAELTVVDNDVLGRIDFLAPLESSGTDAILAGASIWGEAEDTFAADNNSTALVFATNTSAAATERMRISATGHIGIGNSALETWKTDMSVLQLGGDASFAAKTTAAAGNDFFIARNAYWDSTNNRWEYMSTNGDDEAERLVMANGTYSFDLTGTAGADDAAITFTTALKLESTGVVSLPVGQLKFPASQNASSDANTLDDYEEADYDCTTALGGSGNSTRHTLNSSYNTLRYVKIGKLVHLQGYLEMSAVGSTTGDVILVLPFQAENATELAGRSVGSVTIGSAEVNTGSSVQTNAFIGDNGTNMVFQGTVVDANRHALDVADLQATSNFSIGITYIANG